jgi:hypothetical protein
MYGRRQKLNRLTRNKQKKNYWSRGCNDGWEMLQWIIDSIDSFQSRATRQKILHEKDLDTVKHLQKGV